MEEYIDKVAEGQQNGRGKEWMRSEFVIGQRMRLEKEREQAKQRIEKEMKDASERAERQGRLWRDQEQFKPQEWWEAGSEFIDEQWAAGIKGGHSALQNAGAILDKLVKTNAPRRFTFRDIEETRLTFVEEVRQKFERWDPQRVNERCEMDATIKRISDAASEHLDDAYQYPQPDWRATYRLVNLKFLPPQTQFYSAMVYEVGNCDKDVLRNVVKKCTTRSVIDVHPSLVDSIPENNYLLYVGSSSEKEPAFVQRNRDRWWDQQTSNSSTFYLSPENAALGGPYVLRAQGTIAHIFVFLITPSRLRLRLLHCQHCPTLSVSIQENSKQLRHISSNEIPIELRLQDFDLGQFEPGKHDLELVVTRETEDGCYGLRNIFIEFFNDPPSYASVEIGKSHNSFWRSLSSLKRLKDRYLKREKKPKGSQSLQT